MTTTRKKTYLFQIIDRETKTVLEEGEKTFELANYQYECDETYFVRHTLSSEFRARMNYLPKAIRGLAAKNNWYVDTVAL